VLMASGSGGTSERLQLMNEAFLPSAPVHSQELLAGRQEQLFALLEVTQTAGAHAAIFGERGVGKTSVAAVFESSILARGERAVRLNCSAMATFEQLWREMAEEWLSKDPTMEEVSALAALLQGEVTQASLVRALEALPAGMPIVVIFDEFDVIADAGVGADFANLMKAMSDKALSTHVAIVGVAEDVDAILMGHASAARGLHQVRMPRLDQVELEAILTNGFGAVGLKAPQEIYDRIVRLAQGLPHYTHLIGKECARRAILAERDVILLDDWQPALEGALAKAEQQVIDQYSAAVTTAKPSMFPSLLLACALANKDLQSFFRPADVHAPLNALDGKTYAMAGFTGNLAKLATDERGPALQAREFADGRKRYRFANPLLQPYVLGKAVSVGQLEPHQLDDPDLWS